MNVLLNRRKDKLGNWMFFKILECLFSNLFDIFSLLIGYLFSSFVSSVGHWVGSILLDAADTFGTINSSNFNVALIAPRWSPWVSYNVVILSTIVSISNSSHTVVKFGSTCSRIQDTTLVGLEDWLICFNCNRNWANINSSLKLGDWLWSNHGIVCNTNFAIIHRIFASSLFSSLTWNIYIVTFKFSHCVFIILKCCIHNSTFTPTAWKITINKLLFREWKKSTTLDLMSSFNSTYCRESPAWSALTLVLYSVYCALRSPVNSVCKITDFKKFGFHKFSVFWHLEAKQFLIFLMCPCGELIMASCPWTLRRINLTNLLINSSELLLSELIFFSSSKTQTEIGNMSLELLR